MIASKQLPAHERPSGRKAPDLEIHFEVDGTHHRATFPFRVDVVKGQFIVLDGDMQYIGDTKAELIDHMKGVAAKKISLTWTRYIEINYTVGCAEGVQRHSHSGIGPEDDRNGPVTSISLDFEVVEYSNKLETPGPSSAIIRRTIGTDDKPHSEERRWEVPEDVIPYSQERLNALRHLQTAMTAIDARMSALFTGTPNVIADKLDGLAIVKLQGSILERLLDTSRILPGENAKDAESSRNRPASKKGSR